MKRKKLTHDEKLMIDELYDRGEILSFLRESFQQVHLGDDALIDLKILSITSLHSAIEKKIHICLLGNAGRGKSHLQQMMFATILPEEMRFEYGESSPKALIYETKNRTFEKTLIMLDDVKEWDVELLKTLAANNPIGPSRLTVIKGQSVGFKMKGRPVIWFSRVSPLESEDEQLSSRYIYCNIEEDLENEKNKALFDVFRYLDVSGVDDRRFVLSQQILRESINLSVTDFNFEEIALDLPLILDSRKRNFFFSLIQSHALLNWKNRSIRKESLIVEHQDLDEVNRIWKEIAAFDFQKLDRRAKIIYSILGDEEPQKEDLGAQNAFWVDQLTAPITAREISEATNLNVRTVYRKLKLLEERGLVYSKPMLVEGLKLKVFWKTRKDEENESVRRIGDEATIEEIKRRFDKNRARRRL